MTERTDTGTVVRSCSEVMRGKVPEGGDTALFLDNLSRSLNSYWDGVSEVVACGGDCAGSGCGVRWHVCRSRLLGRDDSRSSGNLIWLDTWRGRSARNNCLGGLLPIE